MRGFIRRLYGNIITDTRMVHKHRGRLQQAFGLLSVGLQGPCRSLMLIHLQLRPHFTQHAIHDTLRHIEERQRAFMIQFEEQFAELRE